MLKDFDLTGRKALVTGAGRGIGKGVALALAEAGADVAVTALGQENATKVAREVVALGRKGFGFAVDGTKVEPMAAARDRVLDALGGLDILVNSIGDAIRGVVADGTPDAGHTLTEAEWHTVIDVNLTQGFVGCNVFGPHLLAQKRGAVVNITSFASLRPSANMSAYAAGKAGLMRLTECLAIEWAPAGVRVNAVAPGTFPDPEQMTPEERERRLGQPAPGVPLGRFGLTREVGLLAVYLASDAAAYVTGQTIAIDGGRTLL